MSIWTNKICGWCEKSNITIFIDLNLADEKLVNYQWMCFKCNQKIILDTFLEQGIVNLLNIIKECENHGNN